MWLACVLGAVDDAGRCEVVEKTGSDADPVYSPTDTGYCLSSCEHGAGESERGGSESRGRVVIPQGGVRMICGWARLWMVRLFT